MALLLIAGAVFGPRLLFGPILVAEPVVRGTLLRSVVATGRITTPNRVSIGSQITCTVAEGQDVARGQVLIRLEDAELQAGAAQARSAVTEAEARLRHLGDVVLPLAVRASPPSAPSRT